ncbi:UDP-4-amino-4-deoxy-L-arabinose--oxoglutarate aminotransferase [subsurface metagenome]
MKPRLIPRFNYTYNFSDYIFSALLLSYYKHDNYQLYTFFNTENIFFTNYGRTGLRLILSALGLKKNSKVGVQAYNCQTVFQAIVKAGYQPVFIDINKEFTLDPGDLGKKVENIDALLVNHTFGIPADIDKIKSICHNRPIIEDCAHSLFSKYKSLPTGILTDASFFSFGYGKYPSIGNGGFVIINNSKYLPSFKLLYNQLLRPRVSDELLNVHKNILWSFMFKRPVYGILSFPVGKKLDKKFDFIDKYKFREQTGFYSNTNLFLKKFEKYLRMNEKQCRNGILLTNLLKEHLKCITDTAITKLNYYIFPVLVENRDFVYNKLLKKNIETGKHFALSLLWASKFGYKKKSCPNTESVINKILTIPVHFTLNTSQIHRIAKKVLNSV